MLQSESEFTTKCDRHYKVWLKVITKCDINYKVGHNRGELYYCANWLDKFWFQKSTKATTIPTIYTKNVFPVSDVLPIQAASRYQEVREFCEDWNCLISPFFLKVWTVIAGLTLNHWFFIAQTQKIDILQVWQTIQSTFSHTLNLFSLLPYSTNTTTRTHIITNNTTHKNPWQPVA